MSSPEQSPETEKIRLEEASQLVSDSLATAKGQLGEAKHALMELEKKVQVVRKDVQEADKRVQDADKRVQDARKEVQEADKKVQDDTGDISALQDELHTAKQMLQNAIRSQSIVLQQQEHVIAAYIRSESEIARLEEYIVKLNAILSSVSEKRTNLLIGRRLLGSNPRQKRWDELNKLISPNGSTNEALSTFKKNNYIAKLFESYTSHYQQSKKPIPSEDLKLLCRCLSAFNKTKSSGNYPESFICRFVYTIIATVCFHCEGAQIAIEEMIRGENVLAHGKFEFMIKVGNISICICSKAESLSEGIVQGLTGSEVIAELGNLTTTLCIVTTYRDWIFFKNYEDKITRCDFHLKMESSTSLEPKEDSLETLTGLLFSFLTDL